MSDFMIGQLEHFKKVMEPTPPFLEALIAEKRAHQKLRDGMEKLRDALTAGDPDEDDDWFLFAADLTRILEATDE